MPVFELQNENLIFPPVHLAEPDGLLAIGGDLSINRLLEAYQNGIFPWYADNYPIMWYSPNPRFVLFPQKLKVSKSMRNLFNRNAFEVTYNQNFKEVVEQCSQVPRVGQNGTWITDEMKQAYTNLHLKGWAHSVEVWENKKLVGGLYGLAMGKVFFGESMFSKVSNSSKYGFILLVENLIKLNVGLIDCQVYTKHLESLGAENISRHDFIELLEKLEVKSQNKLPLND